MRQKKKKSATKIRRVTSILFLISLVVAASAQGSDSDPGETEKGIGSSVFDWNGPYIGAHMAYGWGTFQWKNPRGAAFGGKNVPADGYNDGLMEGLQLGYNRQYDHYLVGVEADISIGNLRGYANCGATPGVGGSGAVCKNQNDRISSLTARLGYATGRSLLYAKGGIAYAHDKITVTNDRVFPMPPTKASANRVGWTIGAGVAYAIDPRWSVNAEVDYFDFGTKTYQLRAAGEPGSFDIAHTQYIARLGLNYRLGEVGDQRLVASMGDDFLAELGTRVGYSTGRFQKRLYDAENRNQLFSILTWPDQDGIAPEAFARLDHRSGWFVKGTFGGLDIRSSRMHDEDTAEAMAPGSYSNTVSVTKNGRTLYGTLDLGVLLEKTSGGDLGAFVGYGYYSQHLNAYGCRQVASNTVACHASTIPSSTLVGSEHEEWDAVRLGLAGRLSLTERLKLSGEVAWLPYARFKATDNHWLRPSINPIRQRGSGSRGFQLETSLILAVSRHWDIGAGVRYLSLEADGYTQFPAAPTRSRMEFTSQRTTAFLQTAYRFDL